MRHSQTVGGQIAEAAAIVAATRGDEARGGQKTLSRQHLPARRRVEVIPSLKFGFIMRLQFAAFNVMQNFRPELYAVADGNGIRMESAFLRARLHVHSAEHNLAATRAIPVRQFVSPLRKSQMHGDADN